MRDPSPPPDDIAGDGAGLRNVTGALRGDQRAQGGAYGNPPGPYGSTPGGAYGRSGTDGGPPGGNGRGPGARPAGALSRADQPPQHLPGSPEADYGDDGWAEGVRSRTPRPLDDDEAPTRGRHTRRGRKGKAPRSLTRTILEWVAVIGGGVVIALVIEAFLIQAFWIPSPSMVPTLDVGDRVLVNKLSYRFGDVHRGDVIVFERPEGVGGDESIKDLIKRVVAVGGDTIEARNGLVYVNGERVDESDYLEPGTPTDDLEETKVPEGHVFVMGDNRTNSQDSREFGPVPEDTIIGRAFIRVLPLSDIGWL